MLDRIAPIGFAADEGIKLLTYGRSGTGKTTLWATFPKPILSVIVSGGSKPGELRSIDTAEYRKTIHQVVLEDTSELREVAAHVASTGKYKTLVLDHVTGLADKVLAEILGLTELPAQKTWGLASQQQYGQCTLQCKELLRQLLGLDCNVVIVGQERENNSDGSSELIDPNVGVALSPSLAGWLYTAVDYIGHTYIRQKEEVRETKLGQGNNAKVIQQKTKVRGMVEYCLRTAPDPVYTTKFRQPKGHTLPEAIIDPDYSKIIELIRAGK